MRLEELAGREGGRVTSALVERGVADRVAPVATTAVVVALVMAPFALAGDVAGNEITHSTAAVVLGGLVTSTALSLLILPALYLRVVAAPKPAPMQRAEPAEPVEADLDLVPGI
jgi:Cu/Ag efflux pump CusA